MVSHAGHYTDKSTNLQKLWNAVTNVHVVERPRKANHSRLFGLPLEIRLMIYSLCAKEPTRCKWISKDWYLFHQTHNRLRIRRRTASSSLLVMGRGKIAMNLLLTCKKVYAEAVEDMYKEIKMNIMILSRRHSRVDHWFLRHPFRYTKSVVMGMDLDAETLFNRR
jgi:hypothetical protein